MTPEELAGRYSGIERLLDLDRYTAEVGKGYWVTIRAGRVEPDQGRPHGIHYALTMHEPNGTRILGYDNAHAPPAGSRAERRAKGAALFDHVHKSPTRVVPYRFESAAKLLEDFWADVYAYMERLEGAS